MESGEEVLGEALEPTDSEALEPTDSEALEPTDSEALEPTDSATDLNLDLETDLTLDETESRIPATVSPISKLPRQPKNLDPLAIDKLCQALAAGNYPDAACIYAGVSPHILRRILSDGETKPNSKYGKVCHKLKHAIAQAEVRVVAQWQTHMPRSWQACAAFLQHRYPERWSTPKDSSPRPNVQISVNQAVQTASLMSSSGLLQSPNGRQALLDLVQQLTPDQEQELLQEYKRLQEAAGLLEHPNPNPTIESEINSR
jgi:hypothetical protein